MADFETWSNCDLQDTLQHIGAPAPATPMQRMKEEIEEELNQRAEEMQGHA